MEFLRRLSTAIPDAATAFVFFSAWFAPLLWRPELVGDLMAIMIIEFLVVHSGAFIGQTVLSDSASRRAKTGVVIGFGAFYGLFALAIALAFHRPWVAWGFVWLLVGRLVAIWLSPLADDDERKRQSQIWIGSTVCYLLTVFATAILPVPRFGIAPEVMPALDLVGSGLWVEKPQTVIAAGAVYFSLLAWIKWRTSRTPIERLLRAYDA